MLARGLDDHVAVSATLVVVAARVVVIGIAVTLGPVAGGQGADGVAGLIRAGLIRARLILAAVLRRGSSGIVGIDAARKEACGDKREAGHGWQFQDGGFHECLRLESGKPVHPIFAVAEPTARKALSAAWMEDWGFPCSHATTKADPGTARKPCSLHDPVDPFLLIPSRCESARTDPDHLYLCISIFVRASVFSIFHQFPSPSRARYFSSPEIVLSIFDIMSIGSVFRYTDE